jgi:hypothetical protein
MPFRAADGADDANEWGGWAGGGQNLIGNAVGETAVGFSEGDDLRRWFG